MAIPFKCLGLIVGGNTRRKLFWEPILDKVRARLNVWKGRQLSFGW